MCHRVHAAGHKFRITLLVSDSVHHRNHEPGSDKGFLRGQADPPPQGAPRPRSAPMSVRSAPMSVQAQIDETTRRPPRTDEMFLVVVLVPPISRAVRLARRVGPERPHARRAEHARAQHANDLPDTDTVLVVGHWLFLGLGHLDNPTALVGDAGRFHAAPKQGTTR